jgi:beta-1,4-N-acetylglucosaminyltransferase
MLKLLSGIDLSKYNPLDFVIADTDAMSIKKLDDFKQEIDDKHKSIKIRVNKIKRSRSVGQSYFTSTFTTLLSMLYAIPLIFRIKPKLLLVNGPGTCVPLCLICFLFSRVLFFFIPKCKIVFVESICRVKKLSLTGAILYWFRIADSIVVQWPELNEKYPRTSFLGPIL